jgi:hypothetical protein
VRVKEDGVPLENTQSPINPIGLNPNTSIMSRFIHVLGFNTIEIEGPMLA